MDFGYYNMDCMDGMKEFQDGYFDLAIVDPPYGLHEHGGKNRNTFVKQKNGTKTYVKDGQYENRGWDNEPPSREYFEELFRVSKNQIIWGGNYFNLPPTKCFVVWDKVQPWDAFSQAEIAWTSYNLPAKLFRYSNTGGTNSEKRIHPTQKPIALYEYLVGAFKLSGGVVLDTHVGSASSLIAYHRTGVKFVGFEIDTEMYEVSNTRLERERAQLSLFDLGMERNDNR